jgi:hypothetical protein
LRRDADGGEIEKGVRHWVAAFIDVVGGRGRRGGGVQGGVRVEERDGRREGGPSTTVCGRYQPMVDGRGLAMHVHDAASSRGDRARMSGPRLQCRCVKFNSNSN